MPDTMTPQQRHKCMSHIRGRDTKPEMVVRRWLWSTGWRYRLYIKGFPGKPDIVFRKLKTVIFINGCFWHGHNVHINDDETNTLGIMELTNSDCCKIPHTNRDFWVNKISRNRQRDFRNYTIYRQAGWNVLIIWECMLKPSRRKSTLQALSVKLSTIFLQTIEKKR